MNLVSVYVYRTKADKGTWPTSCASAAATKLKLHGSGLLLFACLVDQGLVDVWNDTTTSNGSLHPHRK